jgi:hypothetical protein
MKQAISGAMADRKRTMKMGVKNKGKNGSQIHLKADSKIRPKYPQNPRKSNARLTKT